MINLQEMSSHEAKEVWEEFCYHNALCDVVDFMDKHGDGKVIIDLLNMYRDENRKKKHD